MPVFHATTTIQLPADQVWAVLAHYEQDPSWRRGVETMAPSTSGPARVGTITAEVLHMAGKTYRNDGEVIAVEPGRRLEWRTTSGADAHGSRSVRPTGARSCEVSLELSVRYHGVQRLMAPVLTPLLRKGLVADLQRLAALVRRQPAADLPR